IQTLTYSVGFLLGLKAFTAAVLGGIGNLRGAGRPGSAGRVWSSPPSGRPAAGGGADPRGRGVDG
ncbi:hypothetical protein AB0G13_33375, partial [Micromonospora sp. NPDC023633]